MTQQVERAASPLAHEIESLGPWFHNLHLPDGTQTAPEHFLGDFPGWFWRTVEPYVPEDLGGWTVLDVGCNAGFYSFKLAERGAKVTAVDLDPHYLRQARWAVRQFGLEDRVEFRQMQVYHLARLQEQFDLVWFMGVLYHLRYPMLGLDIVTRKARRLMMFQTATMPGEEVAAPPRDFALAERGMMREPGWPTMAFIEHRMAGDPTNWWAPNHACIEAMLRSLHFEVIARPRPEIYLCQPGPPSDPHNLAELNEQEYLAATGQSLP
jgi:tRNA (mo5U34)-methyltransferase